MESTPQNTPPPEGGEAPGAPRRAILGGAATLAMLGGLASSYGTLAYMAGRFLYPAKPRAKAWVFVTDEASFPASGARVFQAPSGEIVTVARQVDPQGRAEYLALSGTCPHLGCRVHWEPHNERFFCPCHNGVFTPSGDPVSGPPKEANQPLLRYPVKVEGGLVFIEVATESLASRVERRPAGHGDTQWARRSPARPAGRRSSPTEEGGMLA